MFVFCQAEDGIRDLVRSRGLGDVYKRQTKITLNMGVGEAVGDKKILEHAMGDMTKIAGQKPVSTKALSLIHI